VKALSFLHGLIIHSELYVLISVPATCENRTTPPGNLSTPDVCCFRRRRHKETTHPAPHALIIMYSLEDKVLFMSLMNVPTVICGIKMSMTLGDWGQWSGGHFGLELNYNPFTDPSPSTLSSSSEPHRKQTHQLNHFRHFLCQSKSNPRRLPWQWKCRGWFGDGNWAAISQKKILTPHTLFWCCVYIKHQSVKAPTHWHQLYIETRRSRFHPRLKSHTECQTLTFKLFNMFCFFTFFFYV